MKRLILIISMALTCILVAVANVIIARITGFNIYTIKVWLVVPIGAVLVGFVGASGAVIAARYFNIKPKWIDVVPMVAIAAATMALIYYLDYSTFVLDDGRKVSKFVGFKDFLDLTLTKAHMRVGRGAHDTGEVGEAGYYLAAIEFAGFLIGGAATLFIIKGLPECGKCGAYLRKLKTTTTPNLTFEETTGILELFKTTDFETMQQLLAWKPEERKLDKKSEQAVVTYDLYGCPQCKSQAIVAAVRVFNGKEWKEVPSLTTRRDLAGGLSLRESFSRRPESAV